VRRTYDPGVTRRVEARAPARIDLAGGTVDLWPLSLLTRDGLTVNAAIDLEARAVVERAPVDGLHLVSRDRGAEALIPAGAEPDAALRVVPESLAFVARLSLHLLGGAPEGVRVTTDCKAPAGSGLGGSSTLGIALGSALDRFAGGRRAPGEILALVRGCETQVLAIPTGEQDYHPALVGGALALRYTVEGTKVERLSIDLAALRRHTILVDTGVSRNSGISNWDIFKRHLDGDAAVKSALQETSDTAHAMRRALERSDWEGAGRALEREWRARLRLSPAVTSPRIETILAAAREAGATAGKVCGAGGGGCLVLWAAPEAHEAIAGRLRAHDAALLPFEYASAGVSLSVS
jgi:D-glycero-alpha-D-manno-heptose-7-phosphate kinase